MLGLLEEIVTIVVWSSVVLDEEYVGDIGATVAFATAVMPSIAGPAMDPGIIKMLCRTDRRWHTVRGPLMIESTEDDAAKETDKQKSEKTTS